MKAEEETFQKREAASWALGRLGKVLPGEDE